MHDRLLNNRAGFTLAEVLIALTLTAVLGTAVTGAFISQSRFFDKQEKVGAARAVSRSSVNMILSEVRMVERSGGVAAATADSVTLNVPFAMGLYCGVSGTTMRLSMLPADSVMAVNAAYSGYAYRNSTSTYQYVAGTAPPSENATQTVCTGQGVNVLANAGVADVPNGTTGLKTGTAVFLYQRISYVFRPSAMVPGRIGLWRRVHNPKAGQQAAEEIAAPFAATAGFRYYVGDVTTPQATVASASYNLITGVELTLDGVAERPESDGSFQTAPYTTSVYFKNR